MKIQKRWFFIIVVMSTTIAFAQGTEAEVQQTSLLSLIKTGGWAMWPLGGFSIFGNAHHSKFYEPSSKSVIT